MTAPVMERLTSRGAIPLVDWELEQVSAALSATALEPDPRPTHERDGELRGLARRGRDPVPASAAVILWRCVRDTPEVVLIFLAVVAVVVALFRGTTGR